MSKSQAPTDVFHELSSIPTNNFQDSLSAYSKFIRHAISKDVSINHFKQCINVMKNIIKAPCSAEGLTMEMVDNVIVIIESFLNGINEEKGKLFVNTIIKLLVLISNLKDSYGFYFGNWFQAIFIEDEEFFNLFITKLAKSNQKNKLNIKFWLELFSVNTNNTTLSMVKRFLLMFDNFPDKLVLFDNKYPSLFYILLYLLRNFDGNAKMKYFKLMFMPLFDMQIKPSARTNEIKADFVFTDEFNLRENMISSYIESDNLDEFLEYFNILFNNDEEQCSLQTITCDNPRLKYLVIMRKLYYICYTANKNTIKLIEKSINQFKSNEEKRILTLAFVFDAKKLFSFNSLDMDIYIKYVNIMSIAFAPVVLNIDIGLLKLIPEKYKVRIIKKTKKEQDILNNCYLIKSSPVKFFELIKDTKDTCVLPLHLTKKEILDMTKEDALGILNEILEFKNHLSSSIKIFTGNLSLIIKYLFSYMPSINYDFLIENYLDLIFEMINKLRIILYL